MNDKIAGISLLAGSLLLGSGLWGVHGATKDSPAAWSRENAAHYLDSREVWWQRWPRAQKDHGTVCISCHTQLPYALVRPRLRRDLGEAAMSATEKAMMDSIEHRVTDWAEMVPFYSDAKNGPGKTEEARATEAVLNATILASFDTEQGHLRAVTRTAFENLWALQEESGDLAGGWKWQLFKLGPWEGNESGYQGAALLMVEALNVPGGFAEEPGTRKHLDRVRDYLRRGYAAQPMVNQLYVLWASAKDTGLLSAAERTALLARVRSKQQADGGWRTIGMDERERVDDSPEPTESDGYATGLAVLAMEESGVAPGDATLKRGLDWLVTHQQKDGTWEAVSINKKRDPASDAGPFMKDSATAYAVLALDRQR